MLSSQYVAGCEHLLPENPPVAILTDFDRNHLWSVLVMVGRRLGIPTYSLVHGVLNDHAIGFVPVVADKVFCWGEIDRQKFLAAGTDPAAAAHCRLSPPATQPAADRARAGQGRIAGRQAPGPARHGTVQR